MVRLLDQCAGAFLGDPRFSLFIRPLSRLGGPHDASLRILDAKESHRVIEGLKAYARALGLHVWDRAEQEPMCYAARPNSLVIRANGLINKCTVALQDQRNAVGSLKSDGSVFLNKDAMLPWIRGLWTGRPEDLKCPMTGLKALLEPPRASDTETAALSRT
jgi:uncharacterized protein